jgi:hypothetical protein
LNVLQTSPTTFSETINDINVILIEANDASWACLDNTLAVLSLYTSPFLLGSKYRRVRSLALMCGCSWLTVMPRQEMKKLDDYIDAANKKSFNPAGLNLRRPFETAFLFLEVSRCR